MKDVSYIAFESSCASYERQNKRMFIIIIILVITLIGTNLGWLYYESQFEDITIKAEQQADDQGNNYVIGGNYGEAEGNDY